MRAFVVYMCVLAYVSAKQLTDIPDIFRPYVCRRSHPEYEKCVHDSLTNCWDYFVEGIKELDIPPVDPLHIERYDFKRNLTSDFFIDLITKDITIYGAKDLIFQHVNIGPNKTSIQLHTFIPKVRIRLQYEVDADLGRLPIQMKGYLDGNFTDVSLAPTLAVKKYQKNGIDYFAVDYFKLKFAIGTGHIFLSGSSESEQKTADFFVKFFNQDSRGIVDTISPSLSEHISASLTQAINGLFALLPAEKYQPA